MKVRFFLRDKKAKNPTALYALIRYDDNRVKVYTSESINPKYWNQKTNAVRSSAGFAEAPEFNQRLVNIRSTINRVFMAYKNSNEHQSPTAALLKPMVEAALKKDVSGVDFFSFFEDFARRTVAGSRVDPRTKKVLKGTGGRGYTTTLNHIKEFDKVWSKKVDFGTIGLEFYQDFVGYLASAPRLLSQNSIGSHIQRLKAVMSEAVDRKLTTNTDFKSKRFVKLTEDSDTIYLNPAEIKQIATLDLSKDPKLDRVRDSFLIGCYTGLRFSDFNVLKSDKIKDGYIHLSQAKTGVPVVIPVHKEVARIIKKHGGQPPKGISNVKTNEYLKDIASQVDLLKTNYTKEITKGGVKVTTANPKWKMVSTHAARRSFATNEYNAGTPTLTIMAITGHKTEKAFLKYIRVTPVEHAMKLKEIWAKREVKMKAV